jgi:hypothetical protein
MPRLRTHKYRDHSIADITLSKQSIGNPLEKIRMAEKHSHKFSIADQDAVRTLLGKPGHSNGSHSVDKGRLLRALDSAARQYSHSRREVSRAFFMGC